MKKKVTKAQQAEFQQGCISRNKMLKSINLPTETFEQYMNFVMGKSTKDKVIQKLNYSDTIKSERYVSRPIPKANDDWTKGTNSSKQSPKYSGSEMIGISIIHKSCLQPIFNEQSAKDVANMRR